MEINFNDDKQGNYAGMKTGNFASMMKMRDKQLGDIQNSIRDVLKDYGGESIVIIVQKEDENGMPDHARMLMAGVSRMESQVAMSSALDKAARQAIEVLVDSAKGNPEALIKIAMAVAEDIKDNKKGKK